MEKIRKPSALVEIDIGARDLGPLNIHLWELKDGDLNRLGAKKPQRLNSIVTGCQEGKKMNAQAVQEVVDSLKPHERPDYERRKQEVESLADIIARTRENYRKAGLPIIYSQGHNPFEKGKPTRLHRKLRLESVDKHIRLRPDEDYTRLLREVEKRVEAGGEVTISGGYFEGCVAQAAVTLAAAGYKAVIPEYATDARTIRQSGKQDRIAMMDFDFQQTIQVTQQNLRTKHVLEKDDTIKVERKESDGKITWEMTKTKR
jgi:hypothetical protein